MLTVDEHGRYGARPTARFSPKRLDDLRPEMRPLIGVVSTWRYAFTGAADEPYPGQQRWQSEDGRFGPYWVPAEDLEPIEKTEGPKPEAGDQCGPVATPAPSRGKGSNQRLRHVV